MPTESVPGPEKNAAESALRVWITAKNADDVFEIFNDRGVAPIECLYKNFENAIRKYPNKVKAIQELGRGITGEIERYIKYRHRDDGKTTQVMPDISERKKILQEVRSSIDTVLDTLNDDEKLSLLSNDENN